MEIDIFRRKEAVRTVKWSLPSGSQWWGDVCTYSAFLDVCTCMHTPPGRRSQNMRNKTVIMILGIREKMNPTYIEDPTPIIGPDLTVVRTRASKI